MINLAILHSPSDESLASELKIHLFFLEQQKKIKWVELIYAEKVIVLLSTKLLVDSAEQIKELVAKQMILPVLVNQNFSAEILEYVGLHKMTFCNTKPLKSCRNRDKAWADIAQNIRKAIAFEDEENKNEKA